MFKYTFKTQPQEGDPEEITIYQDSVLRAVEDYFCLKLDGHWPIVPVPNFSIEWEEYDEGAGMEQKGRWFLTCADIAQEDILIVYEEVSE